MEEFSRSSAVAAGLAMALVGMGWTAELGDAIERRAREAWSRATLEVKVRALLYDDEGMLDWQTREQDVLSYGERLVPILMSYVERGLRENESEGLPYGRALLYLGLLKRPEVLPYCRKYILEDAWRMHDLPDPLPGKAARVNENVLSGALGALRGYGGQQAAVILEAGLPHLADLKDKGSFYLAMEALATTCGRPESLKVMRQFEGHSNPQVRAIVRSDLPKLETRLRAELSSPATGLPAGTPAPQP